MKFLKLLFKKETEHLISQTVILALVVGFAAGMVGQIVADVYINPYDQNLGLFDSNNQNIQPIVPELKKVKKFIGIQQDFEVNNSITKVYPSIVGIYNKKASSNDLLKKAYLPSDFLTTGSILTSDGWILSQGQIFNNLKKEQFTVIYNGKVYPVNQLVFDKLTGVSFLKIQASNLPVITLGDSDETSAGQLAVTLNYFSDILVSNIKNNEFIKTVKETDLVVSSESVNRSIVLSEGFSNNYLGAPLINLSGEMIGIISEAGKDNQTQTAVPINQFRNIILDVMRSGQIKRPFLGLNYIDIANAAGLDGNLLQNQKTGALIWQNPKANTPAAVAGLKANDIILTVDGLVIDKNTSLNDIINQYKSGDELVVEYFRQGKNLKANVKLGMIAK